MARSKIGQRAKVVIPTVRGRNVSLVAAMSAYGIIHTEIIDDETCNGTKFCVFIRKLVAILHIYNTKAFWSNWSYVLNLNVILYNIF